MNNNAFVLVPIAQYLGVLHLRATIYNLLILVVGLIGYRVADAALQMGRHYDRRKTEFHRPQMQRLRTIPLGVRA